MRERLIATPNPRLLRLMPLVGMRRHQMRRPKPRQRQLRAMHRRARGDRGLARAVEAFISVGAAFERRHSPAATKSDSMHSDSCPNCNPNTSTKTTPVHAGVTKLTLLFQNNQPYCVLLTIPASEPYSGRVPSQQEPTPNDVMKPLIHRKPGTREEFVDCGVEEYYVFTAVR